MLHKITLSLAFFFFGVVFIFLELWSFLRPLLGALEPSAGFCFVDFLGTGPPSWNYNEKISSILMFVVLVE